MPRRFAKRFAPIWLSITALVPSHGFSHGPLQAAAAPSVRGAQAEIVTVRPPAETMARQGLPYFVGISDATAGARGISMNLVIIPPGGRAKPHIHRGFESSIYVLQGRVETRYGPGLAKSVVNEAGDFLFIPADVPHQPHNLSIDEPAMAIVARNTASEQESVVLYDPLTDVPVPDGASQGPP